MRSIRTLAAALALAAAGSGAAVAAPGLTTSGTDLRSGPGSNYRVVADLPARAVIDVIGCADWCKVDYRGRVGWVRRNEVSAARALPNVDPVIAVVPGSTPSVVVSGAALGWYLSPRGGAEYRVFSDRNGRAYYEHLGKRHFVDRRDVSERRREARDRRERREDYRERVEERRDRWDRRDDRRDRLESDRDRMEDRRDRVERDRDRMEDRVLGGQPGFRIQRD